MYLGNISCLAGTILMITAPGNFVRSGETGEEAYSLLWRMYLRCYAEAKGVMEYLFPALLLTVFALIVCKGILKENLGRNTVLLLLGALLSWGAMILSPHYPDRAAFGTMVLLIWCDFIHGRENRRQAERKCLDVLWLCRADMAAGDVFSGGISGIMLGLDQISE